MGLTTHADGGGGTWGERSETYGPAQRLVSTCQLSDTGADPASADAKAPGSHATAALGSTLGPRCGSPVGGAQRAAEEA